jgi:hypothetical protein
LWNHTFRSLSSDPTRKENLTPCILRKKDRSKLVLGNTYVVFNSVVHIYTVTRCNCDIIMYSVVSIDSFVVISFRHVLTFVKETPYHPTNKEKARSLRQSRSFSFRIICQSLTTPLGLQQLANSISTRRKFLSIPRILSDLRVDRTVKAALNLFRWSAERIWVPRIDATISRCH